MHDPRKPGDICYSAQFRRTYRVLYRDGYDWRVEFENLRPGLLDGAWHPELGDRVIRSGGWNDPGVVQVELFPRIGEGGAG